MNITWLNNKPSTNHFILEMEHKDGTKAYLKNKNYKIISEWYDLAWQSETMVATTLFSTDNKVIAVKYRNA